MRHTVRRGRSETSFSRSLPAEGSAKFKKACLLGAVLVVWAPLSREVRMGTRIVLLSDGTGNSAAKVWRTNVWRVFELLDLTGPDQVAKYDDGVGSSSFKPLAILGGAFGWGLKRNIIDLYKFTCRNYKPGANIYGFGSAA